MHICRRLNETTDGKKLIQNGTTSLIPLHLLQHPDLCKDGMSSDRKKKSTQNVEISLTDTYSVYVVSKPKLKLNPNKTARIYFEPRSRSRN